MVTLESFKEALMSIKGIKKCSVSDSEDGLDAIVQCDDGTCLYYNADKYSSSTMFSEGIDEYVMEINSVDSDETYCLYPYPMFAKYRGCEGIATVVKLSDYTELDALNKTLNALLDETSYFRFVGFLCANYEMGISEFAVVGGKVFYIKFISGSDYAKNLLSDVITFIEEYGLSVKSFIDTVENIKGNEVVYTGNCVTELGVPTSIGVNGADGRVLYQYNILFDMFDGLFKDYPVLASFESDDSYRCYNLDLFKEYCGSSEATVVDYNGFGEDFIGELKSIGVSNDDISRLALAFVNDVVGDAIKGVGIRDNRIYYVKVDKGMYSR